MLVLILMTGDGTDISELPTLLVFPQHSSGSQCCDPGTVILRQSRVERWHCKHSDCIFYCTFKNKDWPKLEAMIFEIIAYLPSTRELAGMVTMTTVKANVL